jgi:hypothetical protein
VGCNKMSCYGRHSLDWKQAVVITVPPGCTQGEECLDQLSESDCALFNHLFMYR